MAKARQEDEVAVLDRANAMVEAQRAAAGQGPSLLEHMWRLLDGAIDSLMAPPVGNHDELVKGQALGIAECIALFDKARVQDVDGVRARAMERYHARQRTRKATR